MYVCHYNKRLYIHIIKLIVLKKYIYCKFINVCRDLCLRFWNKAMFAEINICGLCQVKLYYLGTWIMFAGICFCDFYMVAKIAKH